MSTTSTPGTPATTSTRADLLAGLPDPVPVTAAQVAQAARTEPRILRVVLDDDPTGTQSVREVPVLTSWEVADLRWAIGTGAPAVYVMTNSRSLSAARAREVTTEVVRAAVAAAEAEGVRIELVSRSDSTLRGHFPLETDAIIARLRELDSPAAPVPAGVLLVPAFGEAGRFTVHGVHYAETAPEAGGSAQAVPVGRSEFARDATFGFTSSRLADWVAERTDGAVAADQVAHLDLSVLRAGPAAATTALRAAIGAPVITADAVAEEDLRVLALAIHALRAEGTGLLLRVGPPAVRALIGQEVAQPLDAAAIAGIMAEGPAGDAPGGLVVVGSHVDLTTRQLARLRAEQGADLVDVELEVPRLLGPERTEHLAAASERVQEALGRGSVVLRTSRDRIEGADREDSLAIARSVSNAVVEVVRRAIAQAPVRFVVAKGGITSSDVASRGLGIGRAMVRGPMLPGIVSLWDPSDGPAAHVPYVVFAGNVGGEDSLARVVAALSVR